MTRQWRIRLVMGALVIGMLSFGASQAEARKYCTCIMSTGSGTWGNVRAGQFHSLGQIADYADFDIKAPSKCSEECSKKCSGQAGVNLLGDAANACARMGWKSGCVQCFGYIGNIGTKNVDGTVGKFTCQPAVTAKKCPAGWVCNGCSPQVDGGITTDGKCKKLACQPNVVSPVPANGTPIGSGAGAWGFSWGNAFYAWGTAANGGAPSTVIITPQSASYGPGC